MTPLPKPSITQPTMDPIVKLQGLIAKAQADYPHSPELKDWLMAAFVMGKLAGVEQAHKIAFVAVEEVSVAR